MRSNTAQKRPHKAKTSVSKQNRPNFVSLRGRRAAVAIFKPKAWHPVAKQGSTRREEIPIMGTARRAVPSGPLSPPHFQIPVRSVSSYLVPGWQIVPFKIAASGARALLAMTKLIGSLEKETITETIRTKCLKNDDETFEKRCGATPSSHPLGGTVLCGYENIYKISRRSALLRNI